MRGSEMFGDAWNQISKHHFLNSFLHFSIEKKSLLFFINIFLILFFPSFIVIFIFFLLFFFDPLFSPIHSFEYFFEEKK